MCSDNRRQHKDRLELPAVRLSQSFMFSAITARFIHSVARQSLNEALPASANSISIRFGTRMYSRRRVHTCGIPTSSSCYAITEPYSMLLTPQIVELLSHREVLLPCRCALVWVDLFSTQGQHGNTSGIQGERAHGQDKGASRKLATLICSGGRHLVL